MQKQVRSELIDQDHRIWKLSYEDEEHFLVVSEVIRTHYLKVTNAKNLGERINAMMEFVDQSLAFLEDVPEEWKLDLKTIELLVSISGGSKTDSVIRRKLHKILSKMMGRIMRAFYTKGKIPHKKIPREVIGQEYNAPHPDDFNLVKKYEESLEKPKDEQQKRKTA